MRVTFKEFATAYLTHAEIYNASTTVANKKVYISYTAAPVDEATPDQLIKNACAQLTAALCFLRMDADQLKMGRFRLGKLSILAPSQGYRYFYDIYKDAVNQINARMADKLDISG